MPVVRCTKIITSVRSVASYPCFAVRDINPDTGCKTFTMIGGLFRRVVLIDGGRGQWLGGTWTPAGSRGRAPGQGVRGAKPP